MAEEEDAFGTADEFIIPAPPFMGRPIILLLACMLMLSFIVGLLLILLVSFVSVCVIVVEVVSGLV